MAPASAGGLGGQLVAEMPDFRNLGFSGLSGDLLVLQRRFLWQGDFRE